MKLIYIVGIGPGEYEAMTLKAIKALQEAEVIIGYTVYVDLIKDKFPDKEILSTPMTKEVDRCEMAFLEARKDKVVALICSGDPGVYGMASLMIELGKDYNDVELEIIPGVSAAMSGAAVLGAPLIHDFAVVSLSDRLTPWEKIEKRLLGAAMADFVIVLYNPSSKGRKDYLAKACDILLGVISKETVCGIVENIGREGENKKVLTLEELRNTQVNMFTTVYIGNSQTKQIDDKMSTPRGYIL